MSITKLREVVVSKDIVGWNFQHEYHGKNHRFSQTWSPKTKILITTMIKEASMYNAKWKHQVLKTCEVHEIRQNQRKAIKHHHT